MTVYRNTGEALTALLQEIVERGQEVTVRDQQTREICAQLIELEHPGERLLLVPGRNNNIFAAIAEAMWVLAGRNDLAYLTPYLKRAPDFSDDGGDTWRAGYGPRLRDWNGTDQLAETVQLLRTDATTRRAALTLFDPDRDFVHSNDIPCNNWLHFIARDGRLHLHVAARSTDIWWGFSGINAFEWSILLEMMAHWVGLEVGRLAFFTSSLHLYERHYQQAAIVLNSTPAPSYPSASSPPFDTSWDEFDRELGKWMDIEQQLRTGTDLDDIEHGLRDPLMNSYLRMIDLYWSFQRQGDTARVRQKLQDLGDTDLRQAAMQFIEHPTS
ncbi:thymidylate synthase [Microbacterium sp.]|uniref:thymidylate synthase n=1 Tax=Microbacterium sp. TaxID=51671 RepID=UPI003F6FD690